VDELKAVGLVGVLAILFVGVIPAVRQYEEQTVRDEFDQRTRENFPGYIGVSLAGKSGEASSGHGPTKGGRSK